MEEEYYEIDLRRYIIALFRWWWVIALCALLAGGAALMVSMLMTPTYEASAGVVTLRSQTEISLGSSIQTLTDQDISLAEAAKGVVEERTERRLTSMAGMVKNGAIAEKVSAELSDLLTEEEQQPSRLLGHVKGQILELEEGEGRSDTIEIVVSYDDPEKASAIANAWGREYETYVNQIYGEASVAPFTDINQQVQEAKAEYDQAQEALLTFLSEENRVPELNRQIAEEEAILSKLRAGRQDFASTVVDNQIATQKQIYNLTIASEINSNLKVFEHQRDEVLRDLNQAYALKYRLENLLEDANLMREQLVEGENVSARSNALALLAFKSRVFATAQGLPFGQLDLQLPSVNGLTPESSAAEQIADLDALIDVMEKTLTEQETIIEEESAKLLQNQGYEFLGEMSPDSVGVSRSQSEKALLDMEEWTGLLPYSSALSREVSQEIEQMENNVRRLKAEVARLEEKKANLQKDRDLTWQTYTALLSKAQEIDVAKGARGTEVRFSSPAVPPSSPVSPNTKRNTALAVAVGLMLGVGAAFLAEYMEMEAPKTFSFLNNLPSSKAG
jgi:uncharacterized protein involved in exopolysaccharide biosynthesis